MWRMPPCETTRGLPLISLTDRMLLVRAPVRAVQLCAPVTVEQRSQGCVDELRIIRPGTPIASFIE